MINATWRACKLGDVITLKRGYDLPQSQRQEGPYPICSSSGVTGSHAHAKAKGPGVVTGRYGTLGEVFYIEDDFWPLNTSLYVQDFKGNDPLFVAYFMRSLNIGAQNAAGAVPGVNRNHLHVMEVRVPRPTTQRRIAAVLSRYDNLIDNNLRRIKILERMARALYREWFVEFRFPNHQTHQIVDSALGLIPTGWEILPIDDLCARVTDGSHHSPKSVREGVPMASSKDMHDWGLTLETCRLISSKDYDQLVKNGCRPAVNDVLITKDGANYLKHIFVVREDRELVLLSSVAILTPNSRINPHLLAAILKSPENKDRLKNFVTGAAIPRVILKDFKQFRIFLPTQDVQRAWALIAEPLTQACWTLIEQNQNLRRTRDLLLPRLMSGQITLDEAVA